MMRKQLKRSSLSSITSRSFSRRFDAVVIFCSAWIYMVYWLYIVYRKILAVLVRCVATRCSVFRQDLSRFNRTKIQTNKTILEIHWVRSILPYNSDNTSLLVNIIIHITLYKQFHHPVSLIINIKTDHIIAGFTGWIICDRNGFPKSSIELHCGHTTGCYVDIKCPH